MSRDVTFPSDLTKEEFLITRHELELSGYFFRWISKHSCYWVGIYYPQTQYYGSAPWAMKGQYFFRARTGLYEWVPLDDKYAWRSHAAKVA